MDSAVERLRPVLLFGGTTEGRELAARLAALPPYTPKVTAGYLARYARDVASANLGAILE